VLSWLAPIIVFGLVVFVHELGHFIAAKLTGVYAPRFSIGFGPSLWKRRFGETEYVLAALPLGGYVRMASREDEATAFLEGGSENSATTPGTAKDQYDPDAMIPFGPKPIPEARWFESKPLPARLFIMLAGVTMNALLAYFIYVGLLLRSGIPTLVPCRGSSHSWETSSSRRDSGRRQYCFGQRDSARELGCPSRPHWSVSRRSDHARRRSQRSTCYCARYSSGRDGAGPAHRPEEAARSNRSGRYHGIQTGRFR
jgi:membrane-associated protease RseP (regulator of RpoE activity)